jgi:hypothetical protein
LAFEPNVTINTSVVRPGLRRLRRTLAVAAAVAPFAVAPAIAAVEFVCHPDPVGTRSLSLSGNVQSYAVHDGNVTFELEGKGGCTRQVHWYALQGAARVDRGSRCTQSAAAASPGVGRSVDGDRIATVEADGSVTVARRNRILAKISPRHASDAELIALHGDELAVLTPGSSSDSPAALDLYSVRTSRHMTRLVVPYVPSTLDVYRGTAVFSDGTDGGLYALRLRDGRIAFVGPTRRGDMPQIERPGVVYADAMYKRDLRRGKVVFKYVTAKAVAEKIDAAGRPVTLKGPLATFSMDGPRVAAAYYNRQNGCDRIVFWNVPWNYVAPVTRPPDKGELDEYPTCAHPRSRGQVTALSIAGIQASWTLSGRSRNLVTSSSATCVERVVPTGGPVGLVAGDRHLLAYGTRDGRVGIVVGQRTPHAHELAGPAGDVSALSVDAGRIAVLHGDVAIEVLSSTGETLTSLRSTAARTIALRGESVLALTNDDTLQVFDAATGALRSTWPVPHGVRAEIDAYYQVAVLSRGRQIFALNLATGRIALMATAPRPAHAQIEGPGIAYGYNLRGRGELRFIALSKIERATR